MCIRDSLWSIWVTFLFKFYCPTHYRTLNLRNQWFVLSFTFPYAGYLYFRFVSRRPIPYAFFLSVSCRIPYCVSYPLTRFLLLRRVLLVRTVTVSYTHLDVYKRQIQNYVIQHVSYDIFLYIPLLLRSSVFLCIVIYLSICQILKTHIQNW